MKRNALEPQALETLDRLDEIIQERDLGPHQKFIKQIINNRGDTLITLGTKMELSGFGDFDSSTKIIIRKLVGNQVKKINDSLGDFDRLSLHLKEVHKTEKNQKYQLFGKMEMQGKIYTSEVTDFNLFFALSKVLDKLKEEIR